MFRLSPPVRRTLTLNLPEIARVGIGRKPFHRNLVDILKTIRPYE